jgi:hypothetical protein
MRATGVCTASQPLRRHLLGSTSLLCLALLLSEPARAQDLNARPAFLDRFHFSIEGSLLFNRSDTNLTFDPNTFFPNLTSSEPGRGGGHAGVAFGGMLGPNWDWRVGWNGTWLNSQENRGEHTVIIPANSTFPVQSSNQLWFQTFDAEFGYKMPAGPASLRVFVGPRVLNAKSNIAYGFDDSPDKLGSFDHDVSLWGIGPRGGFDATVPLASSPAFLSVTGSASAIFSRVEHSYNFNSDLPFQNPIVGSQNFDRSRTIYNLEASGSLGYRFTNMATFQIGYRIQHWSDLATTVHVLDNAGSVTVGSSDVLVHGPFARFTMFLP